MGIQDRDYYRDRGAAPHDGLDYSQRLALLERRGVVVDLSPSKSRDISPWWFVYVGLVAVIVVGVVLFFFR